MQNRNKSLGLRQSQPVWLLCASGLILALVGSWLLGRTGLAKQGLEVSANAKAAARQSAQTAAQKAARRRTAARAPQKAAVAAATAQGLVVTPLGTKLPATLAQAILGSGVTVSNVQYRGNAISAGTFTGGANSIGFDSGIVLGNGDVRLVPGPNRFDDVTAENNLGGDSDLSALVPGFPLFDATVLEFDFVPSSSTLLFQYVFTSEEYNEFANDDFNDVFGFFVNGRNVALIPGTNVAVAINNVNGGNPLGTNAQRPQFYINNDLNDGGGSINTEMDGLTIVLSVQANVTPGQVNHLKLAIADGGDASLDSNVFIKATSVTTNFNPELTGLEVTQVVQDLANSVALIQDKPTVVRAHVRSSQGDISGVNASLIGTRLETSGTRTVLGELRPSNNGQSIRVLQSPQRERLDDSFYFELPSVWRRGRVELEFRGANQTFQCREPDATADCKTQVTFEAAPAPSVNLVGLVWRKDGLRSSPALRDLHAAARQIEALYPIPRLNWAAPYNIEPAFLAAPPSTAPEFLRLNTMLSITKLLDGCIGAPFGSCRRYYLGTLLEPSGGISGVIGLASGIPGEVASGYLRRDLTLPHEFGHNAGRFHVNYTGEEAGPDQNYQPPDGTLSLDKSERGFFGYSTLETGVPQPLPTRVYQPSVADLMSYGFPNWVSPYTYLGIKSFYAARYGTAALAEENRTEAVVLQPGQPAVIVSGTSTPNGNGQASGQLGALYQFMSNTTASMPNSGSHSVQIQNAQGQEVASFKFTPDQSSEGKTASFALLLPWPQNAARVMLMQGTQVLDTKQASANMPTVNVTFPNGGEVLNDARTTLRWTASDADNNPLTYAVQLSRDAGASWQTIAAELTTTELDVDLDRLAGGNQALVRVLATDGFFTVQDQSNAPFNLAKHAPQPLIQAPDTDRLYVSDQTIVLEGRAYDNEDGLLADDRLSWSSDLNGALGTGGSLAVKASDLAEGTHTITLTARDADNQTGTANIKLRILRNRPAIPAKIAAAPGRLNFQVAAGGQSATPQSLAIRNDGDGTINWQAKSDQPWLRLAFGTGITPANLPITVNPAGLALGKYTGLITVTSPDVPNTQQVVEVALVVNTNNSQPGADVAVTMTATPPTVTATGQVTYNLTVVNGGPGVATDVILTDALPSALTFASCAASNGGTCNGSGNTRTIRFTTLAAGASATATLTAAVNCAGATSSTINNTVTLATGSLDPNAANNTASAAVTLPPPQLKATLEGNAAAFEFGPVAAARETNPNPPARLITLENTGCQPLTVNFGFKRTGPEVTSGKVTDADDSATFQLRLINANGSETPVTTAQISGGQPQRFRVLFNPLIPAPAGRVTNLFASQVIPDVVNSSLTITPNAGTALNVPLTGRVTTEVKLINPLAPRLAPLVVLAKTAEDEFSVEFSTHDANLDIYHVTYQFLNVGDVPVGDAPGFDLAADIAAQNVLKGQSFTVVKRFAGASRRPEVTKVRVTLYDQLGSVVATSPPIGTQNGRVVNVSAASFNALALAPGGIVAAFGERLATATRSADTTPLPLTLAGTRVFVTDSHLVERAAPLFFVAPSQVNYQLPPGTAAGPATVTIVTGDGAIALGTVTVSPVAPALFTANANGLGVPTGLVLRVRADGAQFYEPLAQLDPATRRYVPLPIKLGSERDQVFLVLFGTGWQNQSGLAGVTAKAQPLGAPVNNAVDLPVLYAGKQGGLVGVDQINLRLPHTLAGRGEVEITVTMAGRPANVVRVLLR
ncbi:MAG: choice-of-anchor L domain-containing protein [Acidobacteria bacterium]|nr:choice-of-anchor L domain-containing protein [Acidobacteriota bacterium]